MRLLCVASGRRAPRPTFTVWSIRHRSRGTSQERYGNRPLAAAWEEGSVDEDFEAMTRAQLIAEARRLRAGIRAHRDSTGHALCWHHPALWGLLPEQTDPLPTVPTWPEFLRGCLRYCQSLDEQRPEARYAFWHLIALEPTPSSARCPPVSGRG